MKFVTAESRPDGTAARSSHRSRLGQSITFAAPAGAITRCSGARKYPPGRAKMSGSARQAA